MVKFEQTDLLEDLKIETSADDPHYSKDSMDIINKLYSEKGYIKTAISLHPFLHEHLIKTKNDKRISMSKQVNNVMLKSMIKDMIETNQAERNK